MHSPVEKTSDLGSNSREKETTGREVSWQRLRETKEVAGARKTRQQLRRSAAACSPGLGDSREALEEEGGGAASERKAVAGVDSQIAALGFADFVKVTK